MGAGWVLADSDSACYAGELVGCLLGLGPYPVFLPYPIVLLPGIRPGAAFAY